MVRNTCDIIRMYKGNKSQKILEMINDKLDEGRKKLIKKLSNTKELKSKVKKLKEQQKKIDLLKGEIEKIKEKLGISWSSWQKEYSLIDDCIVPCSVKKELQNAQDLYGIGKFKEAKKIWEKIIEDFKLGKR